MARYIYPGTATVYLLPSVASLSSVTRAEINAKTATFTTPSSTAEEGLVEMSGFEMMASDSDAADVSSRFQKKVPGLLDAGSPTSKHYSSSTTKVVYNAVARDTTGYVLICPEGDSSGRPYECFPVRVSGRNRANPTKGGDSATFTVQYSITDEPYQGGSLPS